MSSNQFLTLYKREVQAEWRSFSTGSSIFLYVFSSLLVIYNAIQKITPQSWMALLWILILFAALNAVQKAFNRESGFGQIYFYSIVDPLQLLLAKILHQCIMVLILALLTVLGFFVFSGVPIEPSLGKWGIFITTIILGSSVMATTFTFVSALTSKTENQNSSLMAVLSFPLIIPAILTIIKLTAVSIDLIRDQNVWKDFIILVCLLILTLGLAIILFPFVWKD
jgi:heme exporter protein B